MKYQHGVWSYRGHAYPTLREALVDVWEGRYEDHMEAR